LAQDAEYDLHHGLDRGRGSRRRAKVSAHRRASHAGTLIDGANRDLPHDAVGDPEDACHQRGSTSGTFFCYDNGKFNTAGTAFEKLIGKSIAQWAAGLA
jgi:hypothetical protein